MSGVRRRLPGVSHAIVQIRNIKRGQDYKRDVREGAKSHSASKNVAEIGCLRCDLVNGSKKTHCPQSGVSGETGSAVVFPFSSIKRIRVLLFR
jgi:hypothetical protein